MSNAYQTPLAPKRGARASRVTPPVEPKRQPVTNRQWQEQRRRLQQRDIFEILFARLLKKVGR